MTNLAVWTRSAFESTASAKLKKKKKNIIIVLEKCHKVIVLTLTSSPCEVTLSLAILMIGKYI